MHPTFPPRRALRTLALLGLGLVACAAGRAAPVPIAPAASMNERVLDVPGDPQRPAMLKVTVLTPDGAGPFPLAIMNHGASGSERPDLEPRYRYSFSSYYFLSRGYAVALPMMRGFSGSGGHQHFDGCNQEDVGLANARDIEAVLGFMSRQSFVDPSSVVVAGQSFGGWNTLAFGTLNVPAVKGLINFSGGANISVCKDTDMALARAAGHYGARTNTPSLWLYGDNDSRFAPKVWHGMFDHYRASDGPAELFPYGRFMSDSHNLLGAPEGLQIWAPRVDAFLAGVGLPAKILYPQYLPVPFPAPTDFAAIDDVGAVPYLTDEGRKHYRQFLSDPMPRVFVLSPAGLDGKFNGGFDPIGRAMAACKDKGMVCQVYAADDYVAWVKPAPALAPSNFAALADVAAVPYLQDGKRQGYQKFLTLNRPRAFVIAPDGAWFFASLGPDPSGSALASCQKNHQGCQLYAIDDAVVWPAGAPALPR